MVSGKSGNDGGVIGVTGITILHELLVMLQA